MIEKDASGPREPESSDAEAIRKYASLTEAEAHVRGLVEEGRDVSVTNRTRYIVEIRFKDERGEKPTLRPIFIKARGTLSLTEILEPRQIVDFPFFKELTMLLYQGRLEIVEEVV